MISLVFVTGFLGIAGCVLASFRLLAEERGHMREVLDAVEDEGTGDHTEYNEGECNVLEL